MMRIISIILLLGLAPGVSQAQFLGCPQIQQLTLGDCRILEKLFEETDGDRWLNSRGWLQSNQPCDWYGITCASEGWPRSITHINLSANNLTGDLPGELSRLTELRELIIDNDGSGVRFRKLTGTIPAVLGKLPYLEVLILSKNEFSGTIPVDLQNITTLRILKLDDNQLTGPIPEALGDLPSIEEINLSHNNLAGSIPVALASLSTLRLLDLASNRLDGSIPPELGALTHLQVLNLGGNQLTGSIPSSLHNLNDLFWLSLADNRLGGPLPLTTATFASGINSCSLENNSLCIPQSPPYNVLGDAAICGLQREAACRICTEPACGALEEIYQATEGATWTNNAGWLATPSPCDWAGVACTDGMVTGLQLAQNGLKGSIPAAMGTLQDITHLDMSTNMLTGEIPTEIATLTQLDTLYLQKNRLSGIVPLPIAQLGATLAACNFLDNTSELCVPNTAPYQAIGTTAVCGLTLQATCIPASTLTPLTSFEGKTEPEGIRLTWTTTRPSANQFEIEQKQNGTFRLVGSTESTNGLATYSFVVRNLPQGWHVFRLRQIASDGNFSYSNELRIFFGTSVVNVFPNPFRESTLLSFASDAQRTVAADLYDPGGRHVRSLYRGRPAAGEEVSLRIEATGLADGPYFVHITGSGGLRLSQAILLVR